MYQEVFLSILAMHGDTKNNEALGVPLNDLAISVLQRQMGKQCEHVFTYAGRPIGQVNTKHWRAALKRAGITDFRWHDLRHTWASWLRQSDVPTWVLQELGGWKSVSMVRRYAHMSVKHLQTYADQLIFAPQIREAGEAQKAAEADGAKSPTPVRRGVLILASQDGVRL